MDVIGLDKDFRPVAGMRYLNLQWNRRYYQTGQFSMRILAEDYDESIRYVYTSERPEMGYIEKTELSHEIKGDFVQLSGRFMEGVLERMYAYPHIVGSYTLLTLGQCFIERSWYRVQNYSITVDASTPDDISVDVDWKDEPLGECAYTTLKTLEMGQRLIYHKETNTFTWKPWQGLDRTQEQNENPWALFSDDSHHVTDYSYTEDESAYRNHVMILYGRDSIGDPYRFDRWPDHAQEEGYRTVIVRADANITSEERHQKAEEELSKHPIARSADFAVVQSGLLYLQDYDLGDKCDVVCHRLGKSFSARIVEINEVFKDGQHTIRLKVGEPVQTVYERLKRSAKTDVRAKSPLVME